MNNAEIEQAIATARVLPVLRTADAAGAVRAAETLLEAGLGVVELTATTPGWAGALRDLRRARPGAVLGAGTVTTAQDARRAVEAGADFLVSPYPAEARDYLDAGAYAVGVGSDLVKAPDPARAVRELIEGDD